MLTVSSDRPTSESLSLAAATEIAAIPEDQTPVLTFDLPVQRVFIRRVRQDDLLALEWHGGADRRSFYENQWSQHCRGEVCVLIADLKQYPIGHATIHWHGKPTHPAIPDLQSVRVAPGFRGLGIGSRLIEAAEKIIVARGLRQVSLAVGVQNESARRLYERLGYRAVGEPYNDAWQYSDAQGQIVRVEEIVLDMIKDLIPEAA